MIICNSDCIFDCIFRVVFISSVQRNAARFPIGHPSYWPHRHSRERSLYRNKCSVRQYFTDRPGAWSCR